MNKSFFLSDKSKPNFTHCIRFERKGLTIKIVDRKGLNFSVFLKKIPCEIELKILARSKNRATVLFFIPKLLLILQ